jgi:CMP-N-acetylneuraminic acid synthetase
MIIIIPARKGSKGFPLKNRNLFKYTAKIIPKGVKVIVTSNDEDVLMQAGRYGFACLLRKEDLCTDEANIKDVIQNVIDEYKIPDHEFVINLSLTYPERTWQDVELFQMMFHSTTKRSILCAKEPKTHPYMCVYTDGKQIVSHNEYRRQDYPEVLEICHFMSGAWAGEYKNLNKNLYNNDTIYFLIDDKIDVDTSEDYENFMRFQI